MSEILQNIVQNTGFYDLEWRMIVMWGVVLGLLYLAVFKNFEPLLLVPISFGALLANLPTENMTNEPATIVRAPSDGIVKQMFYEAGDELELPRVLSKDPDEKTASRITLFSVAKPEGDSVRMMAKASGRIVRIFKNEGDPVLAGEPVMEMHAEHSTGGLFYYISLGILLELFPPLIFLGVGALTDFGPLIANPRTLILGAAAQFGVFVTLLGAILLDFTANQSAAIGIIGGADGPTSILLANKLAPELLAPIAVAAYSYMSLVPVIQPPIMRALTTEKERKIHMKSLRTVSKTEKLVFALIVTMFCILVVPESAPLIGMLMLGNFIRECGVTERLSKAAQNEIINIVTIFLGTSVGITMTGDRFLQAETLKILALGVVAFSISTASGVLMAKLMNYFSKENPINPLIGSAGVSAVPMAARVSQVEGAKADPNNFLLMHAMGPNVAGVIGTALVAGFFLAMLN